MASLSRNSGYLIGQILTMPTLVSRAKNVMVLTVCQHIPSPNRWLVYHFFSDPSQPELGLRAFPFIMSVRVRCQSLELSRYCSTLLRALPDPDV